MTRIFMLALLAMMIAPPAAAEWLLSGNLPCARVTDVGAQSYNPQIKVINGCGDVVFWALCVNYPSKVDKEYFDGSLQPGEETWIETYPEVGEGFDAYIHLQTMSNDIEYPAC